MYSAKKILKSELTTEELFFAYSKQIDFFIKTRKAKLANKDNPFTFSKFKIHLGKYFFKDFFINVVNVLYAPVYMIISDVAFWFNEIGWSLPTKLVRTIPASWPTYFQQKVENYIIGDIFGFSNNGENLDLDISLLQHSTLQEYKTRRPDDFIAINQSLNKMIKNRFKFYTTQKAEKTDLTISFFSIFLSLIALGKSDWSFYELANNLASFWTKEEAASNFIFGRELGHSFYSIFKQEPTTAKFILSSAVVLLAISVAIQLFCLLSQILQIRSNQIINRADQFIDNIKPRLQTLILEFLENMHTNSIK